MWLKNTTGKKTLIIEKNPYTGGYCTAYQKGDYVFETTQLFPDIIDMMEYLGIKINLKRYENDFMRRIVVHGDKVTEYKIPAGTVITTIDPMVGLRKLVGDEYLPDSYIEKLEKDSNVNIIC
ncbi:MAG TPA: hypothetical protein DEQ09_06880 [Bacteroidales bacterium]|nr:hypothetical protein [Bacteroidales bacterium]